MKRHDLDVFSLVCGLFFVGAAGVWAFADPETLSLDSWPLPGLLIAVGLLGLAASLANRRVDRSEPEPGDPARPFDGQDSA